MSEAEGCCKEPEEESWELHDDKRVTAGKRMPARSQLREATGHELHLVKPSQNNVMRNFLSLSSRTLQDNRSSTFPCPT